MTLRIALVAVGLLAAGTAGALANPPPVGSEDWKIMMPFKEWVISQHDRLDRWCCDIGDGRPVEAELRQTNDGTHWWVFIDPKHWAGSDPAVFGTLAGPSVDSILNKWIEVPDEKIIEGGNPTGYPILWLYSGRVQCFAPTGGV